MNKNFFIELFGWYGVIAIVGAYFANSFGFLGTHDTVYQLLNASGALGIMIESYQKRAYQPMILNSIWLIIGLIALYPLIF